MGFEEERSPLINTSPTPPHNSRKKEKVVMYSIDIMGIIAGIAIAYQLGASCCWALQ